MSQGHEHGYEMSMRTGMANNAEPRLQSNLHITVAAAVDSTAIAAAATQPMVHPLRRFPAQDYQPYEAVWRHSAPRHAHSVLYAPGLAAEAP